ncbi:MAG: penicillin-binding transpeptidase domain-containing protein, partial [Leptonema sp. (in: bacteria)]
VMKKFPDFSYLYNRALRGEYPAASTFKIITSIAALEEGIINENTHIYCPGVFLLVLIRFIVLINMVMDLWM